MKRSSLTCLFVTLVALAATAFTTGCNRGGATSETAASSFACDANTGLRVEQQGESKPREMDPFVSRGKVLIDEDRSGAEAVGLEQEFPEGTELVVTLRDDCVDGSISQSVHDSVGALNEATTPSGVHSFNWTLPRPMTMSVLHEEARGDACVVGVTRAHVARVNGQVLESAIDPGALLRDPLFPQQGHLKMIQAGNSYSLIYAQVPQKPITIAVIDTGIDMTHEDLKTILWTNPREIAANGIDDDKNGYVDDVHGYNFASHTPDPSYSTTVTSYQHGTHVSGLAAAKGGDGLGGDGVMAANARIMMLNVFAPNSSGANSSDIANAIRYAADNGADVINISLGGDGKSATYESALAYAIKKGVTIVVAAGNEHHQLGPNYFTSPASYAGEFDGMIAVASLDSQTSKLSNYSNYSPSLVELAAPGSENSQTRIGLLSTWPGSKYARISGTSMASPVAAGAAAAAISMLRARGFKPSAATIEGVLKASAQPLASLNGLVQGGRALNLKSMADFIDRTYPRDSGTPTDPGVPGFKACP